MSSLLPIGYGDDHALPVGAVATDNIGASTVINMSVAVNPPSLNGINSAVTAQLTNIESAIKDGSVGGASVIIQASASCVTYAMELREERLAGGSTDDGSTDSRRARRRNTRARSLLSSNDDGDDSEDDERQKLAELDALRSDLVNLTCTMGQYTATSPEVEQTFVSMEFLMAQRVQTLTDYDIESILVTTIEQTNRSVGLGEITATTIDAAMVTMSQLITAGATDLDSNESSTFTDGIHTGVHQLCKAITNDLIAGEDSVDVTTDELGLTTLVIDESTLKGGSLSVSPPVANIASSRSSNNDDGNGGATDDGDDGASTSGSSGAAASFTLPETLLDESRNFTSGKEKSEGVSVHAVHWARNPFSSQERGAQSESQSQSYTAMHVNSTVVHLTLTGLDVSGLTDDPIQMRLPLPTGVGLTDDDSTDGSADRRRRRLGSSTASAQSSDNQTHTLECQINETVSYTVESMDLGRASYCNYDIAPTAMPTLPTPDFNEAEVYCSEVDKYVWCHKADRPPLFNTFPTISPSLTTSPPNHPTSTGPPQVLQHELHQHHWLDQLHLPNTRADPVMLLLRYRDPIVVEPGLHARRNGHCNGL